jgi:hypothetical protein
MVMTNRILVIESDPRSADYCRPYSDPLMVNLNAPDAPRTGVDGNDFLDCPKAQIAASRQLASPHSLDHAGTAAPAP